MNLSFMTMMEGKPTFFPEKIIACLIQQGVDFYFNRVDYKGHYELAHPLDFAHNIKAHTIRKDEKNKWSAGKLIHFTIFPRTKWRVHFAPVVPVVSIQAIEIEYWKGQPIVFIDGEHFYNPIVGIDNGMSELAINDGFATSDDFFRYFNCDFKGKIIHWTQLRYNKPAVIGLPWGVRIPVKMPLALSFS